MSALRRPRANFRGVFTTNVPTANNDKVSYALDEPQNAIVNPPDPNPKKPQQPKLPDAAFREWMMQTKTVTDPTGQASLWLNSYFNYFGDSGTVFRADPSAGMPYTSTLMMSSALPGGKTYKQGQDIFLSGRVELLGDLFFDKPGAAKMVDLDPIGIYATQIFSGEIRVVLDTPGGPAVLLSGKDPTRAYIRNMYVDRNITPPGKDLPPGAWMGGAIWQVGLPLESLTFSKGYSSPTLAALEKAAKVGKGLLVRYALYYTLDGIPEGTLAKKFKEKKYKDPIKNPATGMLVGSIGAWAKDELASIPVGRLLYPSLPIPRPSSKFAFNVAMREKSPLVKATTGAPPVPPYYLAPAAVVVDTEQKTVILDLITAIPESTTDLQKANYGDLTLIIVNGGIANPIARISYTQYNRAAYEFGSGIVEVSYPLKLEPLLTDPNGRFQLYGHTLGGTPALQEIDYGYALTDDQCLYLHEGETITYRIQVFHKGQPIRNQVIPITTSQYHFRSQANDPPSTQLALKIFEPLDNSPGREFVVSIPPQQSNNPANRAPWSTDVNPTQYYQTDQNGMITLKVKGLQRGAGMLRYQLAGDNFDPNMGGANKYFYFGLTFYNAFRVLPNDNYDTIPDDQITWDFVYKEVIQYFYLLYPGMFARLPFHQEDVARKYASVIRKMVDKRFWNSTSYMPVSRDLSDGKRKLLQRWCALNE